LIPYWLHTWSIIALLLGLACATVVLIHVSHHPQPMWIMDVVWPIAGLYAGLLAPWGYWRFGRNVGHGGPNSPASWGAIR